MSARRIMHISTRLILGGSQENTVLSCEGQVARGHTVSLVHGPIYGPEGSLKARIDAFNAVAPRPIECMEVPELVRAVVPWKDRRALRDLTARIRGWSPDVVHTHSSKAGILGRMAAWKCEVPCVVHTIHGLAFHRFQAAWKNWIYIRAERHAARRCHRIACVAEAMRDQALAAGIGRPEQYAVVRSGMEIDAFLAPDRTRAGMRAELGFADDDFVVGTVARLAELKGHDDLLDALGAAMQADPHLKLLWVGDGWLRPHLETRLARLGLETRVVRTGLVPPEHIPRMMQAMDLLVHPSYREGLPRTVVQALLSTVPVVAYDVDGTREVCQTNRTGILVSPGDVAGLGTAVRWMRDHPEARNVYARSGRQWCRDQFSVEAMVNGLEALYDEVLNTHDA